MRIALSAFVVCALVACDQPTASQSGPGTSNHPSSPRVRALEELKQQACACKDNDCADRITAELAIEQRHFDQLMEETRSCVNAAGGGGEGDILLGKMREFKNQTCACKDMACLEKVERQAMEWMMKNADKFKDVKPTKAQDEEADKLDDEMDGCKKRISEAQ